MKRTGRTTRYFQRATALTAFTALLLTGCAPPDLPPPLPPTATTLPATTTAGAETRAVTVQRVIDGDTFVTGTGERVRLIGIDTPEISPVLQCYGLAARREADRLLPVNSTVYLTPDPTQTPQDRYERTLAYVQLPQGQDYGLLMLQRGAAREYTYKKSRPYLHQALYIQAQRQAASPAPTTENPHPTPAGLWKECPA